MTDLIKETQNEINNYDEKIKRYEEMGAIEPLTFLDELLSWKEKWGSKTAVIYQDSSITYSELEERSRYLANGLYTKGIRKGDHAMIHMGNTLNFTIILFALFRMGVKPVMMLNTHRENEITAIMNVVEPKVYFVSNDVMGTDFSEIAVNVISERNEDILLVSEEEAEGAIPISALYQEKDEPLEPPCYKETAIYLLSGGTTGIPKVIPRTHAGYVLNAKKCAERCGMDESSVYMTVLSAAHNFPLCCPGILGTFVSGGTVVMADSADPEEGFTLIRKHGVTITSLVPALIPIWTEFYEYEDEKITSLKAVTVGAAKLEEKHGRGFIEMFGCRLLQVYGLAEGFIGYTSYNDSTEISLTTVGKPISEYDEIKIADAYGNELPRGEFGEFLQRGPYTFTGYYHNDEVNREKFTADGFYRTGDRAMIRPDGNIVVSGRVVEQINRAGENVVPDEIESYLKNIDGIANAAVIGVPDDDLGERTCAFIIAEDEEMTAEDIKEKLREKKIAVFKIPDQIVFLNEFPFVNVGKVNKKELLKMVTENK